LGQENITVVWAPLVIAIICAPNRAYARKITPEPPIWRWHVHAGEKALSSGFENGQIEATFEGHTAMFLILASGWNV
jgi:hypothetical protein